MLRMKALVTLICRVLFIALCGLAAWRSVRIAMADWVASTGTLDALQRATRYAPGNARLLARIAIARSDAGDPSPGVDDALRRAAQTNPFDSNLFMTLGLREEFSGDKAQAEADLVHAAEIDHQFKPAWTLANYYYRANQPDKGWPMIERILHLDPLGFDPTPVFELCWRQAPNDPGKILSLIPKRGHRPIQYLAFLMSTQRTDTALDVWREALASADPADASDVATLTGFVDTLANADRIQQAVDVWNQLVDRGTIQSGRLDPAKGISVADPDFQFPSKARAFGWRVAEIPGVSTSGFTGSLNFEINGDEPQSFTVLSLFVPLVSASRYRLVWKGDASSLNSPQDPGFSFRIVQQPGDVVTQCPPLLSSSGNAGTCDFASLPEAAPGRGTPEAAPGHVGRARIDLGYMRAQGTTRVSGILQLSSVHLEFAR